MKIFSKKRIIALAIAVVAVVSITITAYCVYDHFKNKDLKTKIIDLCQTVYDTYGENTDGKYSDFISDLDYSRLNYRYYYEETVREKNDAKLSDLKVEGNTATAYYEYIYEAYDKNNELITLSGTSDDPIMQTIVLEKENNKWKVVKVYEEP